MTYSEKISVELKIRNGQASAAIELLEAGNTLPFIARYRKEMTGSLDEDARDWSGQELASPRPIEALYVEIKTDEGLSGFIRANRSRTSICHQRISNSLFTRTRSVSDRAAS